MLYTLYQCIIFSRLFFPDLTSSTLLSSAAIWINASSNKCQYLFITNFIDCNDSNWKGTEREDAKFGHDSSHDHLFTKTRRKLYFFYFCNKLELSENIYRLKCIISLYNAILRIQILFCSINYDYSKINKL